MTIVALFAASSLFAMTPQGGDEGAPPAASNQDKAPLLDAKAQESLRTKLQKMMAAEAAYDAAEGKAREKANRPFESAKQAFRDEWESRSKKANLLASMPDLLAIYENCFAVGKPPHNPGTVRAGDKVELDESMKFDFSYFLPKKYKPKVPMRTVLMLPGSKGNDGEWLDGRRYFESAWDKTAALDSTIFHIPTLPEGLSMDPAPDYSRDGQEAMEGRRIASVFATFGRTLTDVNVDRPRVFVDCGRGNCAFGLRFVSIFPDRFAGIILRSPTAVEDIRLGSLYGKPVLMIKTAENGAVVETLKKQLEAVTPESVTVIDATDEYPFKGSADAIEQWMDKQKRNIAPTKVIIEPNHNRFNKAYWVLINRMNPIHTSAAENMPRIEVEADRATNRIVVKAQGIESFTLLLNDLLVDLDKEFTVVINDKATTETKTRNEMRMYEGMINRNDWEFLFPVEFTSTVSK
ncbi:MAG: hypothetical protein KDC98_06275 [Planctomycetes bacterium]|nr:hypothetical protein [Planctomycetota bacterium]